MFGFDLSPAITREAFEACRNDGGKHRVCFANTHANALKRSKLPYFASFRLPFFESVGPAFEEACASHLFESKGQFGGYWRRVDTEEEFARISAWTKAQGTRVFLRDCLDMSLALDMNLAGC